MTLNITAKQQPKRIQTNEATTVACIRRH